MIKTITTNDITMNCITFGKGNKHFVILPGIYVKEMIGTAAAIEAAFKDYTEDFTVTLFERKVDMPDPYPVTQMAGDTAAVMRHMGIKNAVIYGASQGAMITILLAACYPELVDRIILASTAAVTDSDGSVEALTTMSRLAREGQNDALAEYFGQKLLGPKTAALFGPMFVDGNRNASDLELQRFAIMADACLTFDGRDECRMIQCPAMVAYSEGDQVFPLSAYRFLADAIKAERIVYPASAGYGHACYDEDPEFKKRMLAFARKRM